MRKPMSWHVLFSGPTCLSGASKGGRAWFRTLLALGMSGTLVCGQAAAESDQEDALKPAIISLKASTSLLLDIERAGERLVAVGSRGHIVYSDDQGASWLQAPVPARQLLTAVDFADGQNGWAVGHDTLILHTADGGESWAVQYRDPEIAAEEDEESFDFLERPLMDVWFRDNSTGFAVGAYGLLLRTDDGGEHWEDISFMIDNPDGFHYNALGEIKDTGLFLVGEMGTMYRSPDFGDTWETLEHAPYDGSWFGTSGTAQAGVVLAWGLRGNMFRSEDFGESWQQVELRMPNNDPLQATLAGGKLAADGRLIVVGAGGVVAISADDGHSFEINVRADRVGLANAVGLPDGGILLAGQRGVVIADASGASAAAGAVSLPVPEALDEARKN